MNLFRLETPLRGLTAAAWKNYNSFDAVILTDHYALEAWERMTAGGLKVPCLPGYSTAHAIEKPVFTCIGSYREVWE